MYLQRLPGAALEQKKCAFRKKNKCQHLMRVYGSAALKVIHEMEYSQKTK
jgi:hypothetical protein